MASRLPLGAHATHACTRALRAHAHEGRGRLSRGPRASIYDGVLFLRDILKGAASLKIPQQKPKRGLDITHKVAYGVGMKEKDCAPCLARKLLGKMFCRRCGQAVMPERPGYWRFGKAVREGRNATELKEIEKQWAWKANSHYKRTVFPVTDYTEDRLSWLIELMKEFGPRP
jgi:hypothetical protein